jgi:phosphoribosylaminoimidazolecarboxamide formyltransferase/IMP cyclohydrolase
MVRGAAKNFPHVIVVVDPEDYNMILEHLRRGGVGLGERRKLARKAFQHVASYDTAIAQYLRRGEESFPQEMTIAMSKRYDLRYGENPHQKAALYAEEPINGEPSIVSAQQLWGKELSHNNIMDADAAWNMVSEFVAPTVAIIKHTNPCGLASHSDLRKAYRRALASDPVSAYGGIVALNRPLNLEVAREISNTFYEIVVAPEYHPEALALLKRKHNLRILAMGPAISATEFEKNAYLDFRRIRGGFLIQSADRAQEDEVSLRTVTQRNPTVEEVEDLLFAWRVVKHVKSNAIVLAKNSALLGMGAGQPNRVTSVYLALRRAGRRARGSVLASDAFFPFPDGVELAAKRGVVAIIQPGGSIRDGEVIKAANHHNMAMVFTGVRHFKH